MDSCCQIPTQPEEVERNLCQECGQKGRPLQRITPESLLLPEHKIRLGTSQYFYCPSEACGVVYFSNKDHVYFHKSDLSVRVGQKESEDPISLCYCFGHTRESVWKEIAETGKSTVQTNITANVKAGLCSCETKNPQGSCCLGNVGKVVKEGFEKGLLL